MAQREAEAEEMADWSLRRLDSHQMAILNERLDDVQEMPRNLSEPRKRYVPSPDLRPEVLEEADDMQKQVLL